MKKARKAQAPVPTPPSPPKHRPPAPPEPLTDVELAILTDLARSPIPRRFQQGRPVTWEDAEAFWSPTPHLLQGTIQERAKRIGILLRKGIRQPQGGKMDPDAWSKILPFHAFMANLFSLRLKSDTSD